MLDGIRCALETCEDFEIVGEAHSGNEGAVIGRTDPRRRAARHAHARHGRTELPLERIRERYPRIKVVDSSPRSGSPTHQAPSSAAPHLSSERPTRSTCPPHSGRPWAPSTTPSASRKDDEPAAAAARSRKPPRLGILKASHTASPADHRQRALGHRADKSKFHLTSICRKLGVASRTEAARYAFEHDLAETPRVQERQRANGRLSDHDQRGERLYFPPVVPTGPRLTLGI